ncbi:MAG: hypothetical protein KAH20_15930 [Methylococcales bacterium]|nr:hypothetical protein [Methylococcales bacterium]
MSVVIKTAIKHQQQGLSDQPPLNLSASPLWQEKNTKAKLDNGPTEALKHLEKESFWLSIENKFYQKKIHKNQTVDTKTILRFLILQDVFGIKIDGVIKNLEIIELPHKLRKQIIPDQAELGILKEILLRNNVYDAIIKRCTMSLQDRYNVERQQLPSKAPHKQPKNSRQASVACPYCGSGCYFRSRRNSFQRIFSNKMILICGDCTKKFKRNIFSE